ncbi:hypothetical protein [Actinophytocola xanthii]|uniref:Gram-positive cocci surface proteins LPxTG domain-containing protein n=1 Tax=Actinophytocola xanthii TaxID=1912961 RepID=A0A1Q8CR13_9PSEU|nr:hypothetical protein [Actinophytocola xanthii]OLF16777.1 hypothetical protein BU204_15035 [Actinophytocola xanthii]
MAHNSTSRRRFGALGAFAVSGMAAAALVGMAGTASAHTPKIDAGCAEDGSWLKVELTQYNDKQANGIAVAVDGEVVLEEEFGKDFSQTWDELDPTVEHEVAVVVQAWDDPDASKGFSFEDTLTIEACVEPEPEPTLPPSSEPTQPSESPSAQPAPTPSVSDTPAPPTTSVEVEEAALAETGASIAIPLGIGAVLLAGGVVLMIVVRRRGRA